MKTRKGFLTFITIMFIFVFLLYVYVYNDSKNKISVKTITVQKGNISNEISAKGIVKLWESEQIFSQNYGKIKRIFVNEGQKVRKGQVLAEIENTDLEYKLKQAELNYEMAKENLRKYIGDYVYQINKIEADYNKISENYNEIKRKSLYAQEVLKPIEEQYNDTLRELEFMKYSYNGSQLNILEDQIKAAEVTYQQILNQIEGLKIKSTIDGIVLLKNVNVGDMVSPGTHVFSLGNPDKVYIEASINENDIPKVEVGQEVLISGEALQNKKYKGKVKRISPMIFRESQNGAGYGKVVIEPDISLPVLIGATVDVDIISMRKENVLCIPIESIRGENGITYVYVINNDGAVSKRSVKLGVQNDFMAEILFGLKEGEKVIYDPPENLHESVKVLAK